MSAYDSPQRASRRSVRTCDARCHDAQGAKCACWCGGLFHGAAGKAARQAFAAEFGAVVADESLFAKVTDPAAFPTKPGDAWRAAVRAAVDARQLATAAA